MMVRLKSRTQWCIDGFKFLDAVISDQEFGDPSWSFERLCQEIQGRRQSNPRFNLPTDMNTIRNEADRYNALRMLQRRGGEQYVIQEGTGPPNFPSPHPSWSGAAAVRQVGAGAAVLRDWLGEGAVPVPGEQASGRAAVCAQCPMNSKNNGRAQAPWLNRFTQAASEYLRAQLALRQDLNLTTPSDEQIDGVCEACLCPLRLKVHVPMEHIKKHLSAEVKTKLAPGCWILTEIK
jgi:hypothetical protein